MRARTIPAASSGVPAAKDAVPRQIGVRLE
jgi:hypothetical protein